MIAFLESLSIWLVDFLLLATVLLAASLFARLVIRQPAGRVTLAWGTWLGMAGIAGLTSLPDWPQYSLAEIGRLYDSTPSRVDQRPEADLPSIELPLDVAPVGFKTVRRALDAPRHPAVHTKPLPLRAGLAGVWLVAFGLALGWIVLGLAQTGQLLRRATAVPAWVEKELRRIVAASAKAPGLWASDRVTSAIALGALKPRIILPRESIVETNGPAVRAALAHEWAHIRHGDLRLLALERLLLPLVFLHPLFWWQRRSVRLEQELLADAAAAGDRPVEYAELLITWARTAQPARHRLAALAIWERTSTLSRRISMLLHAKTPLNTSLGRLRVCALAMLVAPAVLGLSLITVRPLPAQDEAPELPRPSTASPILPHPIARASTTSSILPNPPAVEPPRKVDQIVLELLVLRVDSPKLLATGTSLEDLIAEVTDSRCGLEGRMVVADVNPGEVNSLVDRLKKSDAVKVLSRPRVMTVDGQQAHLQIGTTTPILEIDKIVNGKQEQRVQYKESGMLLMLRPTIHADAKEDLIRLEIVAEQSTFLPAGASDSTATESRKIPGLISHNFSLTRDVKLGSMLLAAESPARDDRLTPKQQLVLLVAPRKAPPPATAAVDPNTTAATILDPTEPPADAAQQLQQALGALAAERAQRAKENESLRLQVEELMNEVARLKGVSPTDAPARPVAILTVYRLRHVKAEDMADALAEMLRKTKAKIAKVGSDAQTNSVLVSVEEQYAADVAKLVESLDRATADSTKAGSAATAVPSDVDRRTQEQLIELDLAEAKLDVEEAEAESAHAAELEKKFPGTLGQHKLRQHELKLQRARIKLRRVQVRLAAVKEQS